MSELLACKPFVKYEIPIERYVSFFLHIGLPIVVVYLLR